VQLIDELEVVFSRICICYFLVFMQHVKAYSMVSPRNLDEVNICLMRRREYNCFSIKRYHRQTIRSKFNNEVRRHKEIQVGPVCERLLIDDFGD
jgi:hypothetical protein